MDSKRLHGWIVSDSLCPSTGRLHSLALCLGNSPTWLMTAQPYEDFCFSVTVGILHPGRSRRKRVYSPGPLPAGLLLLTMSIHEISLPLTHSLLAGLNIPSLSPFDPRKVTAQLFCLSYSVSSCSLLISALGSLKLS